MRGIIVAILIAIAPLSAFAENGISNGSLSSNSNNNNVAGQNNNVTTNNNQQVGSAQTVVQNNQSSEQTIKNVVPVTLTNLTANGSDVCLGSISAGASAPGISITGGKTTVDENCVMMKRVSLLTQLGLTDAAVSLLINADDDLAMAFYHAYPALVEQFAPIKFEEIKEKLEKAEKKKRNCSFNCN